ncbi:MAG: GGDEF domain-containing protein [Desulfosarcinaceae bacterium]
MFSSFGEAPAKAGQLAIDPEALERRRLVQIVLLFGGVAVSILLTISVVNYYRHAGAFIWMTVPTAAIVLAVVLFTRRTGNIVLAINAFGLTMVGLSLILLVSGGVNGCGLLWIYIFPPFIFYAQGFRRGLFYMALLLVCVLAVFYWPYWPIDHFRYSPDYKKRFLLSLFGVVMISAISEYSRQKTHRWLATLAAKLEVLSLQDELTGLANRRCGLNQLSTFREIALRNDTPFSVVILDIDHFKQINDRYGHEAGDAMLRHCAGTLRQGIRKQDLLVRWGGEEFLGLFPNTDLAGALVVAKKMRHNLENAQLVVGNQVLRVTGSFGVAQVEKDESIDAALARADEALYRAKEEGRNRVSAADETQPSNGKAA